MPDTYSYYLQSDPARNRFWKRWETPQPLPRDAAALDRLADLELSLGHFRAADRLAWLAAGLREAAP